MTLEIISYSLETSKAFINNLCSLTREQEQASNFDCHFPTVIYAPAQMEFAQAIKQNSISTRTAKRLSKIAQKINPCLELSLCHPEKMELPTVSRKSKCNIYTLYMYTYIYIQMPFIHSSFPKQGFQRLQLPD